MLPINAPQNDQGSRQSDQKTGDDAQSPLLVKTATGRLEYYDPFWSPFLEDLRIRCGIIFDDALASLNDRRTD
jgi:hypothetical protein